MCPVSCKGNEKALILVLEISLVTLANKLNWQIYLPEF